MTFAEVLAEIPKLTPEQRRELLLRLHAAAKGFANAAVPGFTAERVDGRLVLTSPRIIRQSEVDRILSESP